MNELKSFTPKILVVGDLMIDHYLWGSCDRISPEAPVQIVDVVNETVVLGGAGNTINNLNSLGAKVSVASVIGDDENGLELKKLLETIDVESRSLIVEDSRKTSKKSRIIATGQQVIRYDNESKNSINSSSVDKILSSLTNTISSYEIVVLSDYGKGVLTTKLCQGIIKLANSHNIKVVVDPKGHDFSKYRGAYLLTPNKKEAILATNIEINSEATLKEAITYYTL